MNAFNRFLLLVTAALATQVQAQSMVIKGANILDVTNGELLKNHVVVVDDGRIAKVSPVSSTSLPKGVEVVDLQGHTLMPGLIDMHVHLTSGGGYHGYERLKLTDERRAILGVVHAKQTLMAGFTTVRNVGAGSFGPLVRTFIALYSDVCSYFVEAYLHFIPLPRS